MQSLTDDDLRLLRAAIGLSRRARQSGNEPYGAVLGDAHGRVLLEAQNTQVTERDCTGHAETNLMRAASHRFEPTELAECTVYASGEPCPMCAGAIYWGGVRRVVYALSMRSMAQLAGDGADEINLGCAQVLAHGTAAVEVVGPALEHEARRVFYKTAST